MWAGFAGAGGIIGLFVSAFIIDDLTWPWVFPLPVPSPASPVLTIALRAQLPERQHRFDVPGSILSAVAIGGFVLGFHEGPEKGWTDPFTLAATRRRGRRGVRLRRGRTPAGGPVARRPAFRYRGFRCRHRSPW